MPSVTIKVFASLAITASTPAIAQSSMELVERDLRAALSATIDGIFAARFNADFAELIALADGAGARSSFLDQCVVHGPAGTLASNHPYEPDQPGGPPP